MKFIADLVVLQLMMHEAVPPLPYMPSWHPQGQLLAFLSTEYITTNRGWRWWPRLRETPRSSRAGGWVCGQQPHTGKNYAAEKA